MLFLNLTLVQYCRNSFSQTRRQARTPLWQYTKEGVSTYHFKHLNLGVMVLSVVPSVVKLRHAGTGTQGTTWGGSEGSIPLPWLYTSSGSWALAWWIPWAFKTTLLYVSHLSSRWEVAHQPQIVNPSKDGWLLGYLSTEEHGVCDSSAPTAVWCPPDMRVLHTWGVGQQSSACLVLWWWLTYFHAGWSHICLGSWSLVSGAAKSVNYFATWGVRGWGWWT